MFFTQNFEPSQADIPCIVATKSLYINTIHATKEHAFYLFLYTQFSEDIRLKDLISLRFF